MQEDSTSKNKGFTALEAVIIIIVVFVLFLVGWYIHHSRKAKTPVQAAQSSTISPNLSPGSDNKSLQSDLNSVNNSLTQAGQDLNSSSAAVNDQKNEVSVPTN